MKNLWTTRRILATLTVLTLVALLVGSSCNSNDRITRIQPGAGDAGSSAGNVLSSLPPVVLETELRAASGSPIKLSDYSGKVLLVNLWATWCGPCRMETPELVKLHKEFQSRGVEMIGLSTEDPDASAESVAEFVKEYDVKYHIGWATREVAVTLMQGRTNIPQSFIIARDGRIVKRFIGFRPDATPQQIRDALDEALKS